MTTRSEDYMTLWVSSTAREDISFLVCLMTSRDYAVRESCRIMGELPSS